MKFILSIMIVLVLTLSGYAQEGETPLPEATFDPDTNLYYFPVSLYCQHSDLSNTGPSWKEVTVGQSTLNDMNSLVESLDAEYQTQGLTGSWIHYYTFGSKDAEAKGLPGGIRACIVNNRVQLLDILLLTGNPDFQKNIEDFVIQYGTPDAVTWSELQETRLAFWFEAGVIVEFSVNPINSGEAFTIIYIPYQDIEGYEDRYPYNQTRLEAAPRGDYIPDPPIPVERNPVNFDEMLATITAQPTRTLTPTLTPQASETFEETPIPTP